LEQLYPLKPTSRIVSVRLYLIEIYQTYYTIIYIEFWVNIVIITVLI